MRSSQSSTVNSGPAQLELNALLQQQAWRAKMEQEQHEYRAQERLTALELECMRDQRDQEALRRIQELTDRLIHAETGRLEAMRRAQELNMDSETQNGVKMEAVRQYYGSGSHGMCTAGVGVH
ncbi:hypothetical protein PI126_g17277 [Phytophthora idaei]|nr:hypothetical protein PI126_g17277 [Phytophthora idaei]